MHWDLLVWRNSSWYLALLTCTASLELTFLPSGMKRFPAGRLGDDPSIGLSASLNAAGFKLGRLQTGTPARLDRNTIDFSNMAKQVGDVTPSPFSYLNHSVDNAVRCDNSFPALCRAHILYQANQVFCYQTNTTPLTHQIVKDNLHLSVHIQETRKGGHACHSLVLHPLNTSCSRSSVLPITRSQDSAVWS